MSKNRFVVLGMIAAAVALLWVLPASAKHAATTVTVTEGAPSEFHITVKPTAVKAGTVIFKVTNKGNLPHDFKIGGKKTKLLSPGSSAKLTVTLKKGKSTYECTVSGHAAAGMKGALVVK
jgi:nitrite reductase (NO-forming)